VAVTIVVVRRIPEQLHQFDAAPLEQVVHDLLELEPLLLMYGPLRPATHNHGILESNLFIKAPAREIMVCNPNQYTD